MAFVVAVVCLFAPQAGATSPPGPPPELVSVAMDGSASGAVGGRVSISEDGRYVAFASAASNLVPGDTNDAFDVFVRDRVAGTTTRVSVASDGSQTAPAFPALGQGSSDPVISADGSVVVFESGADNLFPWRSRCEPWCIGELGNHFYAHSMVTGATYMLDAAADGTPANASPVSIGSDIVLSADGRYAAFGSNATNLVSDPAVGPGHVYVKDLQTGAIERVSVSQTGETFDQQNGGGFPYAISDDGDVVVFQSSLPLDPAVSPFVHVFVRHRAAGTTQGFTSVIVSWSLLGGLSGDGRFFAIHLDDGRAAYWDLDHITSAGATLVRGLPDAPLLNQDGSVLYYEAPDVVGDGLGPGIFAVDRAGGPITRLTAASNLGLLAGTRDGRHFAGMTRDALVAEDTNDSIDAYVQDRIDQPPVLANVPADIAVTTRSAGGAVVTYDDPTASDPEDGPVPVSCAPPSGSTFPLGTTRVTCTASDRAGVSASASFDVTVASIAPRILTQPSNQTVIAGQSVSFIATATGTPVPAVQWQERPAGGAWADVAGETATTYTFTASAADSNARFRAVFTNVNGTATSTAATLTVQVPPAITAQPADKTVTAGHNVTFSVAASGAPTPTVQWQQSDDGGASFSDIAGATSRSYTFKPTTTQQGYGYRAVVTNVAGTAVTQAATLTVQVAPVIATQPVSQTVTAGQIAVFSAAASGTPTPTVQWQQRSAGGSWADVPGATSSTYAFFATTQHNHDRVRAVFMNGAGSATTQAAMLTVGP